MARIGEGFVRELPTKECRWKSNDRLQKGIFKKRVTPGKRVSTQVRLIERGPRPPPMSWRVPLLPRLSPPNCSPNPTGVIVSDKEDERGNESNSIRSSCEETVMNIRTACREPATSAHNGKEHHSNDGHVCQDIYAESEEYSCNIIKSRSDLAAPVKACPGPDDADRDSSCKSADSISIRIEVLIAALCEMQPASPRSEGVAVTSCTLPTASPTQRVSSQHANKYWTATQKPDTVNLTARSCESNNRREEVVGMTDSRPRRLKDNSKLTDVDKIEARYPSRVPAAPLPRVHRHRPLWLALRNRTLKITQEDPSIFSPSLSSVEPPSGENTALASTDKGCWHIINRRIFGTHEVSRSEKGIQPEWIIFGGGIPALDTTDQDRQTLRLG